MTSQPEPRLRAGSMNALAHGADSLYTPFANPVSRMTALRGAELIATALDQRPEDRDRAALALGSILCGYAIDSGGFSLHHVICQTLVRICGSPHAETNAAILPAAMAFIAPRVPNQLSSLAEAIGTTPADIAARIRELGGNPPAWANWARTRASSTKPWTPSSPARNSHSHRARPRAKSCGVNRERLVAGIGGVLLRAASCFSHRHLARTALRGEKPSPQEAPPIPAPVTLRHPCSALRARRATPPLPRVHAPPRRQLAPVPAGAGLHDPVLPRLLPLRARPAASTPAESRAA